MPPRRQARTPAPTTLWLARHGHVHNPRHILYGRLPRMRLSAEGQAQAASLAQFFAARPLTAIYSSPMLRARATARAIQAQHPHLPVRIASDLIEVGTAWQGVPHASLGDIDWDFYNNPRHPHDETAEMVRDRLLRWVRRVLRRHAGTEVLGVSHGDPLLIIAAHLRGIPLHVQHFRPSPYIPTASVFRLTFNPDGAFSEATMLVPHQDLAA